MRPTGACRTVFSDNANIAPSGTFVNAAGFDPERLSDQSN
jgi:hypothetical protein